MGDPGDQDVARVTETETALRAQPRELRQPDAGASLAVTFIVGVIFWPR